MLPQKVSQTSLLQLAFPVGRTISLVINVCQQSPPHQHMLFSLIQVQVGLLHHRTTYMPLSSAQ